MRNVLTSLSDSFTQEQIDLYNKLSTGMDITDIQKFSDFYYKILYPHEKFITGLIKTEISDNNDILFIFKNSKIIESNFRYWIELKEGSACCADKSRTILNKIVDFYKNDTTIEFDYSGEYTYHLPKIVFTTHESIIEFYLAIRGLVYGNPNNYLESIKNLINV